MKKKILIIMILVILVLTLVVTTGCNKQIVDLKLKFTNAYVKVGEEWIDVEIKKWTDYEDGDQIQIILNDGTVMLVHSNNIILYNGNLPKGN